MPKAPYTNITIKSRLREIGQRLIYMRSCGEIFDADLIDLAKVSLRCARQHSEPIAQAMVGHGVIAAPQALIKTAFQLSEPLRLAKIIVLPSRDAERMTAHFLGLYARCHPHGFSAVVARGRKAKPRRRDRGFLSRRRYVLLSCQPAHCAPRITLLGINDAGRSRGAGDPQSWPQSVLRAVDALTIDVELKDKRFRPPSPNDGISVATVHTESKFVGAWGEWPHRRFVRGYAS